MTLHLNVDLSKVLGPNHPFAHEQISFVPTRSRFETDSSENTSKATGSSSAHPMQPAVDQKEKALDEMHQKALARQASTTAKPSEST